MRPVLGLGVSVGILVGLAAPVGAESKAFVLRRAQDERPEPFDSAQGSALSEVERAERSRGTLVCPICRTANDQQAPYAQNASTRLVRGVANTAFGWTELLVRPVASVNAGGSLILGIGKGVGHAVTRTTRGISELLTFWTPKGPRGYLTFAKDCPVCLSAPPPPPRPKLPVRSE